LFVCDDTCRVGQRRFREADGVRCVTNWIDRIGADAASRLLDTASRPLEGAEVMIQTGCGSSSRLPVVAEEITDREAERFSDPGHDQLRVSAIVITRFAIVISRFGIVITAASR
jgi:hypothetical protein